VTVVLLVAAVAFLGLLFIDTALVLGETFKLLVMLYGQCLIIGVGVYEAIHSKWVGGAPAVAHRRSGLAVRSRDCHGTSRGAIRRPCRDAREKGLTAGLIEPSAARQIDCAARLEHGLAPKRRRNAVVVTLHDELMVVVNACLVAVGPISLLMLAGAWSPVYRQSWSRLACWWSCLAILLIACAGVTGAILG